MNMGSNEGISEDSVCKNNTNERTQSLMKAAWLIAIVLLGGVGGPFHSATVAVFSKIIPNFDEKAPENVNKLFNTFLTASFLVFSVLAVLVFVFAKPLMGLIISAGDPQLVNLA